MTRYVGLLYSVVVNGQRRVAANDLLEIAGAAGVSSARALLATGNLLFDADAQDDAALERRLESALEARLGKPVPVIVRRADDWMALAAANPFPERARLDGRLVSVRVQRDRLDEVALGRLGPHVGSEERISIVDGNLWVSLGAPTTSTRLLRMLTPRHLGIGTVRNWNTVRRIGEALAR